ncbi:hypothetical protein BN946_scf184985.g66 [Trametes cinnabarina]|uniref:YCII-related domain-containing protein n=1 Tax=Pycnoporus cinnabarinus TaxID=5643 RepID=A0A060SDR0_PYCCI|nr:hypothetical protein BN946_scf184985.g66 [Trametes cinnabarina]
MSDWVPPTYKYDYFLVRVLDVPNAQRAKHYEAHVKLSMPLIEKGVLRLGGALLAPTAKSSDPDALKNPKGSWIFVQAESLEEAWEIVKQDPFYASGEVWDRDTITVEPIYSAMPEVKFD